MGVPANQCTLCDSVTMETKTSCRWYTCAWMHGTKLETCLVSEDESELNKLIAFVDFYSVKKLDTETSHLSDQRYY